MTKTGVRPVVRVELFGEACVHGAAGKVRLSPLQLALVSLVYGHGPEGLSRPRAAGLLWGNDRPGSARQRVRQLLLDVRTRVGQAVIDTAGDALLPTPEVSCDLEAFQAALKHGSLVDAASLIARGFVTTPFPATADAYDDWRLGRSAGLLREVRVRAFSRWTRTFELGDWGACRDAAEALYVLDPHDPQAVERVIEARARIGDLPAAEDAFTEYVASVKSDGEPAVEVVEAVERARGIGRLALSPSERDRPRVPFVGRRDALEVARRSLDAVSRDRFEIVLISGESGIGKTRVLDEIHREAILREFRCLRAQPVELEQGIPLNPILDALCEVDLEPHLTAMGRPWSSVVASLLPPGTLEQPHEEPPPIQASSLPRRLLDAFSLLFEQLASERPTLLFLDDLQWADATTVAALQFIQRRWTSGPLGVIATVRPDLVAPADPVAKYLTGSGGLRVQQIELRALAPSEALELIEFIGEGEVGEPRAKRLCEIAGYHPLYLTELTRDYLGGGLALPARPAAEVSIPTSLEQMLDARLEAMDDRAMRVAGVLAVAAKSMRLHDIAKLSGLALDDAASTVDALLRARFVEIEGNHLRIAHELFRSAVYRHLSAPRRAVHHRAIAAHLLSKSPDESVGELAIHFARAGEDELAAKHGWVAARRALEAGALVEAIQFLEVVAESERDPTKRADAAAELARALHLSRDITRANPLLREAAEQLREVGRAQEARRLEVARIEGLAEVHAMEVGDLLDGLVPIKTEARRAEDWETVALALDVELHLLHRCGDVEGIRSLFREMRDVATKESLEARILSRTGLALGIFFDDPDAALSAAREAVELSAERGGYRLRSLARLIVVLQARGELTRQGAMSVIEEARSLAQRSGDVRARFSIESNLAVAFLDAGDLEQAEVLMERANSFSGLGEMDLNRFIQANNQGELALARRDFGVAAHAFAKAATYLGPTTPTYMQDLVHAGLGYCALETGDLAEARRREQWLSPPPKRWYFDPTTIVAFRARLFERRGQHAYALRTLREAAEELEGRLILAWFKLVLLEVRLMARRGFADAGDLARAGSERARELQLVHRVREFEDLVARSP